jgi:hypothetical protein
MMAQEIIRTVDEILAIAEQLPTMPTEKQVETLLWAYTRVIASAQFNEYRALTQVILRMAYCPPHVVKSLVQNALCDGWFDEMVFWSPEIFQPYLIETAQKLRD